MSWRPLRPSLVALALLACALPATATPPRVEGLWCGNGLLHEFQLRLRQRSDAVEGTLQRKQRVRTILGRLDGDTLHTESHRNGSLVLQLQGDELRITGGEGPLALAAGQSFARARAADCS